MSGEKASVYCWQNHQSHLVEIQNEEQQVLLQGLLTVPHHFWTGGTDLNREGQWYESNLQVTLV